MDVCAAAVGFKYNQEIHLSVRKVNTTLSDLSYRWHLIHLLMMPVLTKTSTLPTQEVIQGQAVEPAVALAAMCMYEARQKAFWLPY